MGIRGLTGFIDRNHHLLHSHELHDCPVVIDGNNLYHFLYYGRHVRCYFGGDYDTYRKRIITTFESFKACGVTPYVVLDGAYTVDGRKLKTSLSRAKARIRLVDCMTNTERGQALPALAYETFVQVLAELEIPHVTCQFEADGEIAVLANKLNCPVISNDSDFYIFDLSAGFLPLDYVDFNVLTKKKESTDETYNFMSVRLYSVDDFVDSFDGLNRSVLPVFASMLGNDFISASSFSSFYGHFKVPRIVSKKFHLPEKLHKVISVLHWLHSCENNMSDVMEKLLGYVNQKNRNKVRAMFYDSVQGYSDVMNFQGFNLYDFFMKKKDYTTTACEEFKQVSEEPFPLWFLDASSHCQLSPFILNAAILNQVIILCQMEDLSQASSYLCSSSIRCALYGILMRKELLSDVKASTNAMVSDVSLESLDDEKPVCEKGDKSDEYENNCIEEYNRLNKGLLKCLVEPALSANGVGLPSLAKLSVLSRDDCQDALWSVFNIKRIWIDQFSEETRLFVACLCMWSQNCEPKLSKLHLDCVLVCVFVLHSHWEKAQRQKPDDCKESDTSVQRPEHFLVDLKSCFKSCTSSHLEEIGQKAAKYHLNPPVFNRKTVYEPQITHTFAQLQSCLVDGLNLNKLLRTPVPNLQPANLINGTLLYNIYNELTSRPKPDLFIAELLGRDSCLSDMFTVFKNLLVSCVGEEAFAVSSCSHLNKKSRKRKSKKDTVNEPEAEHSTEPEVDGDEMNCVKGFNVSNKFALLLKM